MHIRTSTRLEFVLIYISPLSLSLSLSLLSLSPLSRFLSLSLGHLFSLLANFLINIMNVFGVLPLLRTKKEVDRALQYDEDIVVVLRFGHEDDCLQMDDVV